MIEQLTKLIWAYIEEIKIDFEMEISDHHMDAKRCWIRSANVTPSRGNFNGAA